jgi:hypothetical protein
MMHRTWLSFLCTSWILGACDAEFTRYRDTAEPSATIETSSGTRSMVEENVLPGTTAWKLNPIFVVETDYVDETNGSVDYSATRTSNIRIQGYVQNLGDQRAMSFKAGDTVKFYIDSSADGGGHDYTGSIEIYRLGYYGGLGGRFITRIDNFTLISQPESTIVKDVTAHDGLPLGTGLVECNWTSNASWVVPGPTAAKSGVYLAKLILKEGNTVKGESHVPFVIRDDSAKSAILFVTSDATWQAYNSWGKYSLYTRLDASGNVMYLSYAAFMVSYKRPFDNKIDLFDLEIDNLMFYEQYGFDVTYSSFSDIERAFDDLSSSNASVKQAGKDFLSSHGAILSHGHDEYWSQQHKSGLEYARDTAGTSLLFTSGNDSFWKTRWLSALAVGSSVPVRYDTLVSFKESYNTNANNNVYANNYCAGSRRDQTNGGLNPWTGAWADYRPVNTTERNTINAENSILGTKFIAIPPSATAEAYVTHIQIPEYIGQTRYWRNTTIPSVGELNIPLGDEWDTDDRKNDDSGHHPRPTGVVGLSSTTVTFPDVDALFFTNGILHPSSEWSKDPIPGSTTCDYSVPHGGCPHDPMDTCPYGSPSMDTSPEFNTATHNMTYYRAASGAWVFSAGTTAWAGGMDSLSESGTTGDVNAQQLIVNILSDAGIQPADESLYPPGYDSSKLFSSVGLVRSAHSVDNDAPRITYYVAGPNLNEYTVTFVADDTSGKVVAMEVSTDGGIVWYPRDTTPATDSALICSITVGTDFILRVIDDSGNYQDFVYPFSQVAQNVASNSFPLPPDTKMRPVLAAASDTGVSDHDHVTDHDNSDSSKTLTFTINIPAGFSGVNLYVSDKADGNNLNILGAALRYSNPGQPDDGVTTFTTVPATSGFFKLKKGMNYIFAVPGIVVNGQTILLPSFKSTVVGVLVE